MSFSNVDLVCDNCGTIAHRTMSIKSIKDMLRYTSGRCKDCGTRLNHNDFSISVLKK